MQARALACALALLAACGAGTSARAAPLPARVGGCSETTIQEVGPRLEGVPGSGTGVVYANGGRQVSYQPIPALNRSKPGDPVRLCLVSVPKDCPAGDERGRVYTGTNLRTRQSWTAPDSQHMCGGA